jgi:hypothetical protein
VRPPWSIIGRTARAPCLRGPVSSTLGTAMPGLGGTSLLQTPTHGIADTGVARIPDLGLAGPSSTNPTVKSAALRGILQVVSPERREKASTRLSSHLLRQIGSPLSGQSHGRATHKLPFPLWPGRAGGERGAAAQSFTMAATAGSLAMAPPFVCQAGWPVRKAVPNLSLNRSANGKSPWPRCASGSSCASRPRRLAAVARLALR